MTYLVDVGTYYYCHATLTSCYYTHVSRADNKIQGSQTHPKQALPWAADNTKIRRPTADFTN